MIIQKKCACGKKFSTSSYRLESGRGKFCNIKCKYKYANRRSGLKYILVKENPTSFKKGQKSWNDGLSKPYFDKSIGYWKISVNGRSIKFHRYVIEKEIGRKLLETEIVHHIDNNPNNNDINNLKLFANASEHQKHHWQTTRKWKLKKR